MKTADAVFMPKWLRHFHALCTTEQRSSAVPMKTMMMRSATGPTHENTHVSP
jgi:hypothetical protein